jgi:ribonuclease-3
MRFPSSLPDTTVNLMNQPDSVAANLSVEEKMALCEEAIEYRFKSRDLLLSALTHASGASTRLSSNERLEFLGDSILGAAICELLFHNHPEYLEGELTKVKSVVVSRRCCAKVSRNLGLEQCLIVGKGMTTGAGVPKSLLSDVFEALIAAIYLDGGTEAARNFIYRTMEAEIQLAIEGQMGGNYKSALQQKAQRDFSKTPTYKLIDERGPDHSKIFLMCAEIDSRRFSPAWGRNKKEAEQRAAGNALAELRGEEPPYKDI